MNASTGDSTGTEMTPYAWYAIWLLFAVNVLNYVDRMVLAVLVEEIRVDIPMSDTQIGILTGLAFAIFYATAGLAIGRLADLFNRKKLLVISMTAWSAATAVSGAVGNFTQLLLARLAVGTGEAGTLPASQSLIADFCSFRVRPTAYAIVGAGGPVGLAIGLAGGGLIAEAYGWRAAFVAAGLFGLPIILLVALTFKEPPRGQQEAGSNTMMGTSYSEAIRTLLSRKSFAMLVLANSGIAFVLFGVAQWVPAYLIRAFGISTAEVGLYFGIAMGLGSAIGAIIGGWWTSSLLKRDRGWLLRMPIVIGVIVLPIYLAALHVDSLSLAILLILIVNIVGSLQFGAMPSAIHSVVPAGMRGTATSLAGLATSLLGIGLAPFLIGVMSDVIGGGAQDAASLQTALSIAVFATLISVFFLILAKRTIAEDQLANGVVDA